MKIIPRLTLALFASTCAILAVNGYLRVRREVGLFETERSREHDMMGRALATATAASWKADGAATALATLHDSEQRVASRLGIRWVDVGRFATLPIDRSALEAVPSAEPVTKIVRAQDGMATWYTYVPIDVAGERVGAIELAEAATSEARFAHSVVVDSTKTALAFALVSAVLSYVMGQWLLGRPVRDLAEKAQRIGRGDFTQPIRREHKDELADLAREMNAMCDRLSTTIEQLRHADRLATVGKLASGIAHELGTPLNVISARASMIESGDTTLEESRTYARVIGQASDRMTKIIRQLLQFARRQGLTKANTDLHQLASDTIDLLRPLAAKRDVALQVVAASSDANAFVDGAQAQQVVMNLVVNAIQAIPRGGHVTVRLSNRVANAPAEFGGRAAACVCIAVEDDGAGIDEENLARVFEPFFTTKDVGEGTGLGLAVTYGIVRDHGGWIGVESEPGGGSTFTVFLPRGSLA
jgi:signal transduction histidine kinase